MIRFNPIHVEARAAPPRLAYTCHAGRGAHTPNVSKLQVLPVMSSSKFMDSALVRLRDLGLSLPPDPRDTRKTLQKVAIICLTSGASQFSPSPQKPASRRVGTEGSRSHYASFTSCSSIFLQRDPTSPSRVRLASMSLGRSLEAVTLQKLHPHGVYDRQHLTTRVFARYPPRIVSFQNNTSFPSSFFCSARLLSFPVRTPSTICDIQSTKRGKPWKV